MSNKYGIDMSHEHKTGCPRCIRRGGDKSLNNLHVYGEGKGAFCWACEFTIPSDDWLAEHGEILDDEEEFDYMGSEFNPEIHEKLKKATDVDPKGWRGLRRDTCAYFGVRHSFSHETGKVEKQYYPTTQGYELSGYKVRSEPKDFAAIGVTGKQCELFGQFRFQENKGKYLLLVAGEIDCLSAYQILADYQKSKGYDPIPVVSSTIGEAGSAKQIQQQYAFLDQWERIHICYDNDKAGKDAAEKVAKVLPKGKAYIVNLSLKDCNEYLVAGKQKEFIQAFYNANGYTPNGIVGSGELYQKILEEVEADKIPFPPFMKKLNEMTAGGLSLGKLCNIGAATGLGKTVYVDSIIYHLIFNSPYRVGVVSMELNSGQYGLSMLSRHVGRKIANIQDKEERSNYLKSDYVQQKQKELFFKEDGSHRWHLVDDRDGSIEDMKSLVEQLVISCECKVIVLDPLQDILDGMTNEEQALFLKWQKGLIKSHNMSFININHVRKSGNSSQSNSNGGMITEEDFAGSSTIMKSAALNILLVRDKMNEDPIIRNTTKAFLSKNRDNGITGPAGSYYYNNDTHQLQDFDEWLQENPQEF